ncbi:MAG TPA: hypothetical protein VKS60_04600 [Stellaceae bacterium]|nr:hypothetical protein [Stellaceae bacterium]
MSGLVAEVEDSCRSDLSWVGLEIERWDATPTESPRGAEALDGTGSCTNCDGLREHEGERTRLVSWTDRQMGIFGTIVEGARGVAIDSVMTTDVLAFAVRLQPTIPATC